MRVLKTYGEGADAAADVIAQVERRSATNTARVDGVVREIVAAVRERGDAALREYAARFDGLNEDQPLLVRREEMQAAWESMGEDLKAAMRLAQANIRAFAEKQLPRAWSFRPSEGMEVGQIVRPLGAVGCYVPRWTLSTAFDAADDHNAGAGGRRGAHRCVLAQARAGDAGRRLSRRRHRVLSRGRSAGHRRHGLWHGDDGRRRQDRRAGQFVCDCRQGDGVRRLRHRYAGRADGDCCHQRRRRFDRHRRGPRRTGRARS